MMIPEANAAIEAMMALVEQKAKELVDLKRATNVMCRQLRLDEIFAEVEEAVGGMMRVKSDQFYGKSPIVAAREYLEMKQEAVRAEEILEALVRGGFDFNAQNWPEKERLRLLSLSLSKNSVIFHRLPNGTYGLLKRYPDKAKEKNETGKPEPKKAQPKVAPKAKTKAKPASQPPAPPPAKQGGAVPAEAVARALSGVSGQFTIDDVLPKMDEGARDRAKVREELNRRAKEEGSGVRLVKKGALKQPAVYERTTTAKASE